MGEGGGGEFLEANISLKANVSHFPLRKRVYTFPREQFTISFEANEVTRSHGSKPHTLLRAKSLTISLEAKYCCALTVSGGRVKSSGYVGLGKSYTFLLGASPSHVSLRASPRHFPSSLFSLYSLFR